MNFPLTRLRRLRLNSTLRNLVQETHVGIEDCVFPLFIRHGNESRDIHSMPGCRQLALCDLAKEINEISKLGIHAVMLFGIPQHKDGLGRDSYQDDGIIQRAIKTIKDVNPAMLVMTDVCFCEYTDHGHCGFIDSQDPKQYVDNDKTLDLLVKQAISHVNAGCDVVVPSGMMDGVVLAIRQGLDASGFPQIPILCHSAKYASSFYGPFREAAEGAPKFGDRKTYQMNPANGNEALREAKLDIAEGADMLMIKPAGAYLDVIYRVKQAFPEVPVAAYQVSGEFSMIKFAAKAGLIDERQAMLESLLAIKRAGADFIITYFAKSLLL